MIIQLIWLFGIFAVIYLIDKTLNLSSSTFDQLMNDFDELGASVYRLFTTLPTIKKVDFSKAKVKPKKIDSPVLDKPIELKFKKSFSCPFDIGKITKTNKVYQLQPVCEKGFKSTGVSCVGCEKGWSKTSSGLLCTRKRKKKVPCFPEIWKTCHKEVREYHPLWTKPIKYECPKGTYSWGGFCVPHCPKGYVRTTPYTCTLKS